MKDIQETTVLFLSKLLEQHVSFPLAPRLGDDEFWEDEGCDAHTTC